jgi:DNA-binding MarR family transcriptional regulator
MHLIVLYINRNPGSSQEEITGFYALDKASVARDARRLEDLGHIQRNKMPENRRQYRLYLTDAGRDMIRIIDRAAEQFQKILAASISPEDWAQLELLLKRLEENVRLP